MDQDLKDGSLEMDRDLNEFSGSGSNVEGRLRNTNNGGNQIKSNKCNYASSYAGDLRRHLKTHSGEKPNKCNQCDYASSQAISVITHPLVQAI